jgi:hypothetical protein
MTSYFRELERQLSHAADRQQQSDESGRSAAREQRTARRRRVAVAAAALLVLGGVPAAALTDVFSPHREVDGLVRLSEKRKILDGFVPIRGRWELIAYESDAGFCLETRLRVEAPAGVPGDLGTETGGGCGGPGPGSLTVGTFGGGDNARSGLAVGTAPEGAASIRVTARHLTVTVPAREDDAGLPGRFYVAELPLHTSLGPTVVEALDRDGRVIAKATFGARGPLDASPGDAPGADDP